MRTPQIKVGATESSHSCFMWSLWLPGNLTVIFFMSPFFFFLQQCFKHPFFSNLYSSLYPQLFLDDLTSYFIKEVDPISWELLQFLTLNFSLSCTHFLHLLSCYREGIPCSHAGPSLCVCSESHSFPPSQGPFSVSCLF